MSWRDSLRPNSFRGAPFHVEEGGQAGGRRNAVFEYPKSDTPFAEDMGRRGRRFTVAGYVLGPNYQAARDALVAALEQEGPGTLVHQTIGSRTVSVETYSTRESTRKGGAADFDMVFIESGSAASFAVTEDTRAAVIKAADAAQEAARADLERVGKLLGLR